MIWTRPMPGTSSSAPGSAANFCEPLMHASGRSYAIRGVPARGPQDAPCPSPALPLCRLLRGGRSGDPCLRSLSLCKGPAQLETQTRRITGRCSGPAAPAAERPIVSYLERKCRDDSEMEELEPLSATRQWHPRTVSVLLHQLRLQRAAPRPRGARPEHLQVLARPVDARAEPWVCSTRVDSDTPDHSTASRADHGGVV